MFFAKGEHGVCFSDLPCSVDEEWLAVCRVFPFDETMLYEPFHDMHLLICYEYSRLLINHVFSTNNVEMCMSA